MSTLSHIILGIGNKGKEYHGTRHNIGFDVIDALVAQASSVKPCQLHHGVAAEVTIEDKTVLLLKPMTYVNLSGLAAQEALDRYNLPAEKLLVVVDDFHLPLGTLRFRSSGSAGGHNGLKSLITTCGPDFHRLRFGVGPLPEGDTVIDFVLGLFQEDETTIVKESTDRATAALRDYLREGLAKAMNLYNS